MGDSESASDTRNPDAGHRRADEWPWAIGAGVITAVAVFVAVPNQRVPLAMVKAVRGPDVQDVDLHGGVRITYRAPGPGDAVAQTARILERRAAQLGPSRIEVADGEITIEVAGVAPEAGATVARMLTARGELSFHRVATGSELARALCLRAEAKADPSISCEPDAWTHETSVTAMGDFYLAAPDRGALERFLARAAAEDPALAPEPGRALLFEHVRPAPGVSDHPDGFEQPASFWRTYYVEARPELGNEHIAEAYVYWDEITGRAAVLVRFDDAGAARLHELTRANVGGKLAIVLDGEVTSAPVIQEAIDGGRVTITMGGSSAAEIESEARALAAILQSRTVERLPVELALIAAEPIARTVTREQRIRATVVLALLAGMAAFALVRLAEKRALPLDVALPGPAGARPWGRLAVTVAALVVVYAGTSYVMLPGLEGLDARMAPGPPSGEQRGLGSVFTLGLGPFLSAFVLVEIVALLVPRWRPLRIGGPAGRARLLSATVVLGVLLTLLQSWFLATWISDVMAAGPSMMYAPSTASVAVLALTATAGVLVLWILAGLVSRHGLGNGISVILLAGVLGVPGSLLSLRQAMPGSIGGGSVLLLAVAACAVAVITARVLRARVGGPLGLRLPTCGIIPVVEAASLMALPSLALVASGLAAGAAAWMPDGIAMRLALVAALAVAFSLLFSRPALVTGQVRVADAGAAARRAQAFWLATAVSAAYVVGMAGLGWLLVRWSPGLDALVIAMSTAIVMDLVSEWRARRRCRDLVAVWPVHRVQVADIAVRALEDAGIGAHTRGRYHRSLLYFFGPFVPIDVMVPADRAEEAAGLLRSMLGGDAPAPQPRDDSDRTAARSSIL